MWRNKKEKTAMISMSALLTWAYEEIEDIAGMELVM